MNTPTLIVLLGMCAAGLWGYHSRGKYGQALFGGAVIALVMMLALVVAVK